MLAGRRIVRSHFLQNPCYDCGCRKNVFGLAPEAQVRRMDRGVAVPSLPSPPSRDINERHHMHDQKTQQQFIELRVQGRSYARIAEELQVSRRTLIDWGRKFQFEIHNARVVEMEALRERFLVSREEQVRRLGERLAQVEAELAGRGVAELSTPRLFALAESLRRQIQRETGAETRFSAPVNTIPADEYHEDAQDWIA